MVSNTSELLPEPETPVNTVSRRFGISMLTSLRLFTRAPCTRIRSWLSATSRVALLIVSPSRVECSAVLQQPEDVAVGVGERGYQAAAADVARGLLEGATRGGDLGQLRLDVGDVPVGDRRAHPAVRHQA